MQTLVGENAPGCLGVTLQGNDDRDNQVAHRPLSQQKVVSEPRGEFLFGGRQVSAPLDQKGDNRKPGTAIQPLHGCRQQLQDLLVLAKQLEFVPEPFPLFHQASSALFPG